MTKSLPARPDLGQLKTQAKELLESFHRADAAALARVRAVHPLWSGAGAPPAPSQFKLHDAQWVLAREYGFPSWPRLKEEVEILLKNFAERADMLLEWLCAERKARAMELLEREPQLATANFLLTCATANLERVRSALIREPALAVQPGGKHGWTPIIATCFSAFLKGGDPRAASLVQIAELLLQNGADPNAVNASFGPEEDRWRLSVLYAAAGRANHYGMTRLLLDAGANPNDGESLYHSTEFHNLECTRLLLDRGARIEGTNAVHRQLDFDDLEGLRLLLDRGADPNMTNNGSTLLHWAISRRRRIEFLELLAARGADLKRRDGHGLTPYELAVAHGYKEGAQWLERNGAAFPLDERGQFIAALVAGDEPRLAALLAAAPDLPRQVEAGNSGFLAGLAWRGQEETIRRAIKHGLDPGALGSDGQTALHNACWMGYAGIVEFLLSLRVPLEVVERTYSATPMVWALHGSIYSRDASGTRLNPEADYLRIVRALLAAGAKIPERLYDDLDDEIRWLLKQV